MGLFGKSKKVDACIAFVGSCSSAVSPNNEKQLIMYHHPRVLRFAEQTCPELPLAVWYWNDWSKRVYSPSVLREVEKNGFSAYDTGDKKKLFDEIFEILVLQHGVSVGKLDYSPACMIDQGLFVLLFRVPVKESTLPG